MIFIALALAASAAGLLPLLAAARASIEPPPPAADHGHQCPSGYQIRGSCVPPGVSPLDFYVNRVTDADLPPPRVTQTLTSAGGCALTVLNFTSQRWLTDAEFKDTSAAKSTWSHQLIVAAPPNPKKLASTGWLWITGGHNPDNSPVSPSDSEVAVACSLALSANTVGAVLHQVPNQPVQFAHDIPHSSQNYPNETRTEDGIISYTWNHFCFNDSSSPEWLLRLPMTKAVSRAMDVLQGQHPQLHSFVVGGASKRGWTTWTTGLVEKRTKAIVPVVMDLLNLANGTDNHYRSLGGYTFEFADYLEAGVVGTTLFTKLVTPLPPVPPWLSLHLSPSWGPTQPALSKDNTT
jgi:PhoPQ-activated pathogenicity-related protein